MTRVAVFIDYQNVYMGARETFGLHDAPFTEGQIFPRRAGILVADRGRVVDPARELASVNVYRGEPSAKHTRTGQAACQRQVRYWSSQALVRPIVRPLHYYQRSQDHLGEAVFEAREKGIDVCIAIDMAMGAMRDEYDVCVLFSGDTDLVPALEAVLDLGKRCEVVAWHAQGMWTPRLNVPGKQLWCHWLDEGDYRRIHDPA